MDNEGYFTSDFNEKAEIPEDIKIHSSTMENFIKAQNNGILQSYTNIDIAKTVGNAYKIVSQLIEKTPELKGKSSFSKEDLANYFPQNYLIDKNTLEVKQTFSYEEMKDIIAKGGFKNINENEKLSPSFLILTIQMKNQNFYLSILIFYIVLKIPLYLGILVLINIQIMMALLLWVVY
ncbi:hypothetical protein K7E43_000977 [Campylobacter coli]|nr:hypothetical protein [Campylobacter coli]EIA3463302.1 hypothetical protein [Campylobacter coli]EIA3467122.1 hypothetical protein [Campylobacter coli]EIQ1756902.1 hypothetical protein [Campylobacter coli]EIT3367513.1 hypothetical protein [Campylobacter coli]